MYSNGDLVRCVDGTWMVLAPSRCANGHPLDPNRVLVGHQPCAGTCRGGRTTWECLVCCAVAYSPGIGAGCRLLDAAAFVR